MLVGFFVLVEALVSALLIAVILVQKSKGGMGGSAFGGGGMGEAIFGSRMGNVLTKATVILGIIFLVNTILLTIFMAHRKSSGTGSVTDGQTPISQPAAPMGGIAPMAAPVPSTDVPPESAPVPIELPPMDVNVDVDAVAPIEIPAPIAVEAPVE